MDLVARIDKDLADLAPEFIQNRKSDALKLRHAAEIGDLETLRHINHDIRGIASPYGFDGLDALCKRLAKATNKAEIFSVLADLDFYLANVEIVEIAC